MAPKKKKSKNKELNNEIKHLTTLLNYTEKNINGQSQDLDKLFTAQSKRIKAKIKKVEGKQ